MSQPRWGRLRAGIGALLLWGAAAPLAAAGAPVTVAQEAARVGQAAARLPEAEAGHRLARALGVGAQQVMDLREQKLGFGDAAAALAIARASGRPVNPVVTLWANERLGWNDVAARLGAGRARVVRLLRRARRALEAGPSR